MVYVPGQCGNPTGRPKGSKGRVKARVTEILEIIDPRLSEIINNLIEQALDKDKEAAKILLSFIPKPRWEAIDLNFNVKNVLDTDQMKIFFKEVLTKATSGELSAEQGKSISDLTKTIYDLEKLSKLEERIKMLEVDNNG